MVRSQTKIGGIVAQVVMFLLLCGIVFGEFPELLSLIDNTSNDVVVRITASMAPSLPRGASKRDPVASLEANIPAHDSALWHLTPFEAAELVPSDVYLLYSILRT